MEGPELTHKGQWQAWFLGLFVSVVNVCSIIFAEELFYWNLAFRVRDAYRSEPSDWEITSRYIGWFVMTGAAAVLYLMGLQ